MIFHAEFGMAQVSQPNVRRARTQERPPKASQQDLVLVMNKAYERYDVECYYIVVLAAFHGRSYVESDAAIGNQIRDKSV